MATWYILRQAIELLSVMMSKTEVAEYQDWQQELGAEQPGFESSPAPPDWGCQHRSISVPRPGFGSNVGSTSAVGLMKTE